MNVFQAGAVVAFCIAGSAAVAQDRTYDFAGFDEVVVTEGVSAEIVVGEDFAVTAEALRGDIDRLVIEQSGDRLEISRDSAWGLLAVGKRDRFAVQIAMPVLTQIESNSGATTQVEGADAALTRVTSSSGATLVIEDAELADVRAEATSGASLKMSGQCAEIEADSSSGASLNARELICKAANVHSSSGSSLAAFASETALAEGSSGASIRLRGGAELVSRDVSSGASIRVD